MKRQRGKNANECNSRCLGEAVMGWEAMSALGFTDLHNVSWTFVSLGSIMVYVTISTHYSRDNAGSHKMSLKCNCNTAVGF